MFKGAKKGERGFTLVEMLIVVAMIGIIAVIATVSVSQTLKKQRVEAAAYQLQSFIEGAQVFARERSRGIFVWLHRDHDPENTGNQWWYCYMIEDTNQSNSLDYVITDPYGEPPGNPGANADTFIRNEKVCLPEDIVISPSNSPPNQAPLAMPNQWPGPNNWPTDGVDYILEVDPRGFPYDATLASPLQLINIIRISLTHVEMTDGRLLPPTRYDISISPLWHTKLDKTNY